MRLPAGDPSHMERPGANTRETPAVCVCVFVCVCACVRACARASLALALALERSRSRSRSLVPFRSRSLSGASHAHQQRSWECHGPQSCRDANVPRNVGCGRGVSFAQLPPECESRVERSAEVQDFNDEGPVREVDEPERARRVGKGPHQHREHERKLRRAEAQERARGRHAAPARPKGPHIVLRPRVRAPQRLPRSGSSARGAAAAAAATLVAHAPDHPGSSAQRAPERARPLLIHHPSLCRHQRACIDACCHGLVLLARNQWAPSLSC